MYGAGIGVAVDIAKARMWFEKAAAANSAEAMFQLGMMTQDGDGGAKDDAAAQAWFERSGCARSRRSAGATWLRGTDCAGPKDIDTGAEILQTSGGAGRRGCAGRVEAAAMSVHAQGQERQGRRQHVLRRPGLITFRTTPRTDAHHLKNQLR